MIIRSMTPSTPYNSDSDVDVLTILGEHLELVPLPPGVVVLVLGHCCGDVKHHVLIIKYLPRKITFLANYYKLIPEALDLWKILSDWQNGQNLPDLCSSQVVRLKIIPLAPHGLAVLSL